MSGSVSLNAAIDATVCSASPRTGQLRGAATGSGIPSSRYAYLLILQLDQNVLRRGHRKARKQRFTVEAELRTKSCRGKLARAPFEPRFGSGGAELVRPMHRHVSRRKAH